MQAEFEDKKYSLINIVIDIANKEYSNLIVNDKDFYVRHFLRQLLQEGFHDLSWVVVYATGV